MSAYFTCHRGIAPMFWVFVVLGTIELLVVHALLAIWWPWVAIALSVATLASIGWLVWAIGTLRSRPSVVDQDRVVLRAGAIKRVTLSRAQIGGLRDGGWTAAEMKAPATLNLALVAWPNVVIDVAAPVAVGRRQVTCVAHRLDDPAGFATALERVAASD